MLDTIRQKQKDKIKGHSKDSICDYNIISSHSIRKLYYAIFKRLTKTGWPTYSPYFLTIDMIPVYVPKIGKEKWGCLAKTFLPP